MQFKLCQCLYDVVFGDYTSWEVNSRLSEASYIGLQTTFDGSRPNLCYIAKLLDCSCREGLMNTCRKQCTWKSSVVE
jgi:hypothetical protein